MSGLSSAWSDFKETFFPSVAYAEESEDEHAEDAPEESQEDSKEEDEDKSEDEGSDESAEDSEEGGDDEKEDGDGDDEDEEDEDEDDDDEDEDELVDPLDSLREKYTETVCHPFKHHFDECVERVTKAQEEPDYEDREYKEDCIEEFFHLQHCLNDNIAPVLFSKLK